MRASSRMTFMLTWASLYKYSQSSSSGTLGSTTKNDVFFGEFTAEKGWHRNRRTAKTRVLEYGKQNGRGHPFEKYSSDNLANSERIERRQKERFELPATSEQLDFQTRASVSMNYSQLLTADAKTSSVLEVDYSSYKPLRIYVDSRRLELLVESDPDYYADIVDYMLSKALPKATRFWSDHLSTIPVEGNILIYSEECSQPFKNDDSIYHEFKDTDLVLYLILDEGPCVGNDPPIAFSNDCVMDQFDRPAAGWLLLCSTHFLAVTSNSERGEEERQKLDEVLQHEIAHVLGMSGTNMPYFRDQSNGGAPRTPRPLVERNVTCVNGEIESIILPSNDTVRAGTTNKGVRYFEVVTPTVRNVVANQFNCGGASGARLENQEYYNCIGSHWEARIFGTETMVTRNMPYEQSITAVTLALFEDTGWYKANFSASIGVSSPSSFGYGAGCGFLYDECIVDGEIPDYSDGVFCNEMTTESSIKCDVAHNRAGKCDLVNYTSYNEEEIYPYLYTRSMPTEEYQHFSDEGLGAFLGYDADYCPTYSAPPYFTYSSDGRVNGPQYLVCSDGDTAPSNQFSFETYGKHDSKCFDTIGQIGRPVCLSVRCKTAENDIFLEITLRDGEMFVCENDYEFVDIPGSGVQIQCPRKEIICPEVYCPANCSGRGECEHGVVKGCHCFDPTDDSPMCTNSPVLRLSPTPFPSQTPSVNETPSSIPSQSTSNYPSTSPMIGYRPSSEPNYQLTVTSQTFVTNTPSTSPSLQITTTNITTRTDTLKPSEPTRLDSNSNENSLQSRVSLCLSFSLAFSAVFMQAL